MSEMQYKTEEYVVVFIDILGATKKISKEQDQSLNIVHAAYNQALEVHKKLYGDENSVLSMPEVKIFSDNIVIATKSSTRGVETAFWSAVVFAALIQIQFLTKGYLVRGGMTIGDYFIDDTMVWGQALVRAHVLESSVAIYPRIVIDPKTVGVLHLAEPTQQSHWICEDKDGLFFIDYIQRVMLEDKKLYPALLDGFAEQCDDFYDEAGEDLKIVQKINWHVSYLASKFDLKDLGGSDGVGNA